MKLLFSTDQIYLHGGLEKVIAEKANYFVEVFHYDVAILTTEQKGNSSCYHLNDAISIIDIGVNYDRDKSFFHPNNIKKIPFHFKQWEKVMNQIQPDFLIVCNQSFDFYWAPFFNNKIKKIKEYHSTGFNLWRERKEKGFIKKIQFAITDFVESKFDKIVLLNIDEKEFYKSKNVIILPNAIQPTSLKTKLVNKKVIAAGRIAPVKGFENLIASWELVVQQQPDWQLHIYGQGEPDYVNQLQKIITNKNLSNYIIIKPAVSNLLELLSDYSIYIMSSLNECFPMVLLESLSVGLPIISFDCPTGPRNIITDSVEGYLVENQNIEQLAGKIVFLIQNDQIRFQMGMHAKLKSKFFDKELVMNQWNLFFNQLNN